MRAECIICLEHFQSSDAISASHCGHVFHEACIERWLGESGAIHSLGQCPQCRSTIDQLRLTRLFFTDSSVSATATDTGVNHQRVIDELQERITFANKRIAGLTAECRGQEDSIVSLTVERRQKTKTINELRSSCQQKDATIEELTNDISKLKKKLE